MAACSLAKYWATIRALGMRSQVQPLSFSLPFLSFSMMRLVFGLPAVGGDQVTIVLHRLGPVVHQVLIDIVRSMSGLPA